MLSRGTHFLTNKYALFQILSDINIPEVYPMAERKSKKKCSFEMFGKRQKLSVGVVCENLTMTWFRDRIFSSKIDRSVVGISLVELS